MIHRSKTRLGHDGEQHKGIANPSFLGDATVIVRKVQDHAIWGLVTLGKAPPAFFPFSFSYLLGLQNDARHSLATTSISNARTCRFLPFLNHGVTFRSGLCLVRLQSSSIVALTVEFFALSPTFLPVQPAICQSPAAPVQLGVLAMCKRRFAHGSFLTAHSFCLTTFSTVFQILCGRGKSLDHGEGEIL
jgi:hypothetical protein